MFKFPEINRHAVGISALALAIIGLGIVGSMPTRRLVASLPEMSGAQVSQPIAATDFGVRSQIPPNAYGSAQPSTKPIERNAQLDQGNPPQGQAASEGRNWTDREWQIATMAVSAFRKVSKAAEALSPSASSDRKVSSASTNSVWQPPEEIANGNRPAESR